jgi:hypothetical protein
MARDAVRTPEDRFQDILAWVRSPPYPIPVIDGREERDLRSSFFGLCGDRAMPFLDRLGDLQRAAAAVVSSVDDLLTLGRYALCIRPPYGHFSSLTEY